MSLRVVILCVSMIAFSSAHACVPDLPSVKKTLIHYVESGDYRHAVEEKVATLRDKLNMRMLHSTPKERGKWAFVFDIDETLLSNFNAMKDLSFGGNAAIFEANDRAGKAVAIAPVRALYHYVQKQGIPIFIVSGRSESVRQATIANLRREGIEGWSGLFFFPKQSSKTVLDYKDGVRCTLAHQGYHLIVNIGDQQSDLDGSCSAEYNVKLPNPFYEIPANRKHVREASVQKITE